MTTLHRVRRAEPGDRSAVVETVTRAFADDPGWTTLLGDDYGRLAPAFAGALFDSRVGGGTVWVTPDLAAVAMWDPPRTGEQPATSISGIWEAYRRLAGAPAWATLEAYEAACSLVKPQTRYWYLGVLATQPERQAEGLATAVIAPGVQAADAAGLSCCLETSSASNKDFYDRRGFTVATPVPWADGPPTWWLRRPTSGAGA